MPMNVELHIKTGFKNNKTHLETGYCTQPFKIANITENKAKGDLQLMLMSASPGILDGDNYHLKIELVEHSFLQLQTQSYQRLFSMKQGAKQNFEAHLAQNSTFIYLPHPLVPHESSDFFTKNDLYLSDKSTLIWGEILTCGRKLNGEIFKFSKLHSLTNIYLNNRLIIKENLFFEPDKINLNAIGQLENHSHQASLIYLNDNADLKALNKKINDFLTQQKDIVFGISELQINGLIVRILGQKAEQLYDCLKLIGSSCKTT
jgi:urease accessory protein